MTLFQLESYTSASAEGWIVPMWIGACAVAPAGEEVLFRGLMYRGWVRSDRSAWRGIVAISLAFAALHVQYDNIGIAQIFVVGMFLGWMRWRSGSTLLTFLLHGLFNIEGTLETVLQLHYFLVTAGNFSARASGFERCGGRAGAPESRPAGGRLPRGSKMRSSPEPSESGRRARGRPITGSVKREIAATDSSSGTVLFGVSLTMVTITFISRRYSESSAVKGVADGAEIAAGHQDERHAQRHHPVEHGVVLVERHHDAADALDQQDAAAGGHRATAEFDHLGAVDGAAFAGGRHVGRQRRREPPGRDAVDLLPP